MTDPATTEMLWRNKVRRTLRRFWTKLKPRPTMTTLQGQVTDYLTRKSAKPKYKLKAEVIQISEAMDREGEFDEPRKETNGRKRS